MFRNVITALASQDDLSFTRHVWTVRLHKFARFNFARPLLPTGDSDIRAKRIPAARCVLTGGSVGLAFDATKHLLSRIPLVIPIEVLRETDEMSALTRSLKAPQYKTSVAVQ